MKKYLKRILIILLILIVIVGYYANKNYKLYIRNKDNIFTSKFNMRPYMIKQAEKQMHKDGQQAKVGEYTITLLSTVYDREKCYGWCKFKITADETYIKEVAPSNLNWYLTSSPIGWWGSEYEDTRFEFFLAADSWTHSTTHGNKRWYEVKDNELYAYIYIGTDSYKGFNNCIYIYKNLDVGSRYFTREINEMAAVFELRDSDDVKEYSYSQGKSECKIQLTPYTIDILGNKQPELNSISIRMKNGTEIKVKENGTISDNIRDNGEYVPNDVIKTYMHKMGLAEKINLEDVDCVMVDGEKVG